MQPRPTPGSRRERQIGQSTILFALFLPLLIGMAGIVLDLGYAYAQHRFMQNAADASALHAIKEVAGQNFSGATTAARNIGKQNVASTATPNITILYNNDPNANQSSSGWGSTPTINTRAAWAKSTETHPTFVMRALGMNTLSEWGESIVAMLPSNNNITTLDGLQPICIEDQWIQKNSPPNVPLGTKVPFWDPQNDGFATLGEGAEWKGLCNLDGPGRANPQDIGDWALYGYPRGVSLSAQLGDENGDLGNNYSGSLRQFLSAQNLSDGSGVYGYITTPRFSTFIPGNPNGQIIVSGFVRLKVYVSDVSTSGAIGAFVPLPTDGTPIPGSTVITSTSQITFKMTH